MSTVVRRLRLRRFGGSDLLYLQAGSPGVTDLGGERIPVTGTELHGEGRWP